MAHLVYRMSPKAEWVGRGSSMSPTTGRRPANQSHRQQGRPGRQLNPTTYQSWSYNLRSAGGGPVSRSLEKGNTMNANDETGQQRLRGCSPSHYRQSLSCVLLYYNLASYPRLTF
jgi:hypothetical protein